MSNDKALQAAYDAIVYDKERIAGLEAENAHQQRMLRAAFEREHEGHEEFATDEAYDRWLRIVALLAEIARAALEPQGEDDDG